MLELLRNWLNSNKNYHKGVLLLSQFCIDKSLLELLAKGPTPWGERRLYVEILKHFNNLKNNAPKTNTTAIIKSPAFVKENIPHITTAPVVNFSNTPLYAACKKEADKVYKECMNNRATLFAMARTEDFEDPNDASSVKAREKLAIQVVLDHQKASALYERADYVKIHGRLPVAENMDEEYEYGCLPDHLVKQTLDNLRKACNKLKNREQTAERISAIAKKELNIKKLEYRWHLLKPKK